MYMKTYGIQIKVARYDSFHTETEAYCRRLVINPRAGLQEGAVRSHRTA